MGKLYRKLACVLTFVFGCSILFSCLGITSPSSQRGAAKSGSITSSTQSPSKMILGPPIMEGRGVYTTEATEEEVRVLKRVSAQSGPLDPNSVEIVLEKVRKLGRGPYDTSELIRAGVLQSPEEIIIQNRIPATPGLQKQQRKSAPTMPAM